MLFNSYIPGQDNPNEIIFHVPIESAANLVDFYPYAPAIKYVQHGDNSCVLISLSSSMFDTREHVSEQAIYLLLESFFRSALLGYIDRINFTNRIMTECVRDKFEQRPRYKTFQLKKSRVILYFNDISDHVVLVQLIGAVVNANHDVSIILCLVYDFN